MFAFIILSYAERPVIRKNALADPVSFSGFDDNVEEFQNALAEPATFGDLDDNVEESENFLGEPIQIEGFDEAKNGLAPPITFNGFDENSEEYDENGIPSAHQKSLTLVNKDRSKQKLSALKYSSKLSDIVKVHNNNMIN